MQVGSHSMHVGPHECNRGRKAPPQCKVLNFGASTRPKCVAQTSSSPILCTFSNEKPLQYDANVQTLNAIELKVSVSRRCSHFSFLTALSQVLRELACPNIIPIDSHRLTKQRPDCTGRGGQHAIYTTVAKLPTFSFSLAFCRRQALSKACNAVLEYDGQRPFAGSPYIPLSRSHAPFGISSHLPTFISSTFVAAGLCYCDRPERLCHRPV